MFALRQLHGLSYFRNTKHWWYRDAIFTDCSSSSRLSQSVPRTRNMSGLGDGVGGGGYTRRAKRATACFNYSSQHRFLLFLFISFPFWKKQTERDRNINGRWQVLLDSVFILFRLYLLPTTTFLSLINSRAFSFPQFSIFLVLF